MNATPVIAVFDVGKTNKKLFLFDEQYRLVFEKTARLTETVDEDGFPCENLESLRLSTFDSLHHIFRQKEFRIRAINFATYGASLVHIDRDGQPLTPLYNYLKDYPADLLDCFYEAHGGRQKLAMETASPVLGNLNSGLQLYRLKHQQPAVYRKIRYSLHLPQYMSYLLTGNPCTDMTSIGCHTQLWNFRRKSYHEWVRTEGLNRKFAPIVECGTVVDTIFPGSSFKVGIGLHDSSSALIPYLVSFREPFVLLSTGTWCISLNPFNTYPLTAAELEADCLSYLSFRGQPVKASRFFGGHEHELQVRRIAEHFHQSPQRYRQMAFKPEIVRKLSKSPALQTGDPEGGLETGIFRYRGLESFANDTEAYHQLIMDLVDAQYASTNLILQGTEVRRIFVDGGFSGNAIFMNLLAEKFPEQEVFAASMAQATAIGAALAIHGSWNTQNIPSDIIGLKFYAAKTSSKV